MGWVLQWVLEPHNGFYQKNTVKNQQHIFLTMFDGFYYRLWVFHHCSTGKFHDLGHDWDDVHGFGVHHPMARLLFEEWLVVWKIFLMTFHILDFNGL